MEINEKGLDIIKQYESLQLKAYLCPNNKWTIGWGHTKNAMPGMSCTVHQAAAWLVEDCEYVENLIKRHVKIKLTENQFAALGSLIFNTGPGKKGVKSGIIELFEGGPSTLLKKLNVGDIKGAAEEFPRWNKSGGKVLSGLVKRRYDEQQLFLTKP